MKQEIAWLILRVVYAWMFLYPLVNLIPNFQASVGAVKLVIPFMSRFFAVVMLIVMIYSGLSILVGFYAQIAGFLLLIYCLLGVVVHYRLVGKVARAKLSASASVEDQRCFSEVVSLGILGNKTSGQKNMVLAAVACFFMLLGSGPLSLTMNLF